MKSFPLLISIVGGAMSATYWLFQLGEKLLTPENKQRIVEWIESSRTQHFWTNWPDQFRRLFDSVLGKKLFTAKSFVKSAAITCCSTTLVTLFWMSIHTDEAQAFLNHPAFAVRFVLCLVTILLTNVPVDYLSLMKTRYIIGLIKTEARLPVVLGVVLFDILVSYLIACTFAYLYASTIYFTLLAPSAKPAGQSVLEYSLGLESQMSSFLLFAREPGWVSTGIFLYPTFFASLWLMLYVASGALVGLLDRLNTSISKLVRILHYREHPLTSLGAVASVLVGGLALILFLVVA